MYVEREEKLYDTVYLGRPHRDLNTRPCDLQSHALTTELRSREAKLAGIHHESYLICYDYCVQRL